MIIISTIYNPTSVEKEYLLQTLPCHPATIVSPSVSSQNITSLTPAPLSSSFIQYNPTIATSTRHRCQRYDNERVDATTTTTTHTQRHHRTRQSTHAIILTQLINDEMVWQCANHDTKPRDLSANGSSNSMACFQYQWRYGATRNNNAIQMIRRKQTIIQQQKSMTIYDMMACCQHATQPQRSSHANDNANEIVVAIDKYDRDETTMKQLFSWHSYCSSLVAY